MSSSWTRAPPASGGVAGYGSRLFAGNLYKRNLRPIVIANSTLGALWSLLWGISSFKDISLFSGQSHALQTFSLILGILYMVAAAIEIFGIFAAVTQRNNLVRMYAYASCLSLLLIVGAGLLLVIIHFTLKNATINACTNILQSDKDNFGWGLFGGGPGDIDVSDIPQWCSDAWGRASWSDIISLLIEIALGVLFVLVNFAYLRQVLDPSSPANFSRAPSNQVRRDMGLGQPDHYNPPYDGGYVPPNLGYAAPQNQYAPPPGAPPANLDGANKPPAYMNDGFEGSVDAKHGDNPFADFEGGYSKNPDARSHEDV